MKKLMCYVGLNPIGGSSTEGGLAQTEKPHGGGIAIFEIGADGYTMEYKGCVPRPVKAGALFYAKKTHTLYAVDEKKTEGRGELAYGSAVYAFHVDQKSGMLEYINHVPSMGPNPTDVVAVSEKKSFIQPAMAASTTLRKSSRPVTVNGVLPMIMTMQEQPNTR